VPTLHLRKWLRKFKGVLRKDLPLVSGCKGIEKGRLKRASEIIREELGSKNVLVLSGPSHAEEVAMNRPTTVVVAGDEKLAKMVQGELSTERFRVYTDDDIIGVELGGALKQIIGIACGICDGLGFGDNTKAALMTRGVVEIARLGAAMGADPSTFWGLSGIGDIITTAVSPFGRNRAVGEAIGRGKKLREILKSMEMVAEGIETTRSAMNLAKKKGIEMPIAEQVYKVLYRNKSPLKAVSSLMMRAPRREKER
jgi:glycerol-3-phosphate dehydrogenase (NAD(P)+)